MLISTQWSFMLYAIFWTGFNYILCNVRIWPGLPHHLPIWFSTNHIIFYNNILKKNGNHSGSCNCPFLWPIESNSIPCNLALLCTAYSKLFWECYSVNNEAHRWVHSHISNLEAQTIQWHMGLSCDAIEFLVITFWICN